jgi:hypothetical protein
VAAVARNRGVAASQAQASWMTSRGDPTAGPGRCPAPLLARSGPKDDAG